MHISHINNYKFNNYNLTFFGEYSDRVRKIEKNNSFFSKAYWNAEETVEEEMKREIENFQKWAAEEQGKLMGLKESHEKIKKDNKAILNQKKVQLDTFKQNIENNNGILNNLENIIENLTNSGEEIKKINFHYKEKQNEQNREIEQIETNIKNLDIEKSTFIQETKQDYNNKIIEAETNHRTQLDHLSIKMEQAIESTDSTQQRIRVPKKNGFGLIPGYKVEKDLLRKFFGEAVILNQIGETAKIPNGILLFGLDNDFNRDFAIAAVNQYDCNLLELTSSFEEDEIIESLYTILEQATENYEENNKHSVIFISDFDKKIAKNSVLTEIFKTVLDDIAQEYHATIFATSSKPDEIDDILLRTGRFDLKLPLSIVHSEEDFKQIIKRYLTPEVLATIDIKSYAKFLFNAQKMGAFTKENIVSFLKNIVPKFGNASLEMFEQQKGKLKYL